MILRPDSANMPFDAAWKDRMQRSALPEDITSDDRQAMAEAAIEIGDPWIRARFADIVWLSSKPRNTAVALLACDSYSAIPLESSSWAGSANVYWARAIALCLQLGHCKSARLEAIYSSLLQKARSAQANEDMFLCRITELLHSTALAKQDSEELATLLQAAGAANVDRKIFHLAERYFGEAASWFARADNEERRADCICAMAETRVSDAEARVQTDPRGHGVAVGFYKEAIQIYRKVPRSKRATRSVDARVAELQRGMDHSAKRMLELMVPIASGGVDLHDHAEAAIKRVQGLPLGDAIFMFCKVAPILSRQACFDQAPDHFRQSIIYAMVSKDVYAPDGRLVARRRGVTLQDAASPEFAQAHRAEAITVFATDIPFQVRGRIYPALRVILREHRFLLSNLLHLARLSPIVADGRERLVAKALFLGFEEDFEAALHMVTPQIEHIARCELKRVGARTTVVGADDIEAEKGLSSLADMPEFEAAFGIDLAFTIRAVCCDSFGPNLRNKVAHGLLPDGAVGDVNSVYAWWLLLRLVFQRYVVIQPRSQPV